MILLRHAFQKNLDSFKYSMLIGCLRLHNHYHTFEYKMTHWITHFMIHRYKWLIYYADVFFKNKIENIENNENRKRFLKSNVEHWTNMFCTERTFFHKLNILKIRNTSFFNLPKEWFISYESYLSVSSEIQSSTSGIIWTAGPIK